MEYLFNKARKCEYIYDDNKENIAKFQSRTEMREFIRLTPLFLQEILSIRSVKTPTVNHTQFNQDTSVSSP